MNEAKVIRLVGDPHQDIRVLLPWYVTGRLEAAERARVEAHLAVCPSCREALAFERSLEAGVARARPEVDLGWRAMLDRIETGRSQRGPAAWLGATVGLPRWLGLAASFLALAFMAVAIAPRSPAYHALGAAPPAGNVLVIFRPEATEGEMRATLTAAHARLTDGPNAADAYVLQVPEAGRAAAIAFLRKQPAVVLAEPVDGGR